MKRWKMTLRRNPKGKYAVLGGDVMIATCFTVEAALTVPFAEIWKESMQSRIDVPVMTRLE